MTTPTDAEARRLISLIDLTNLDDNCTPDAVDRLCDAAVRHGTAAVCVWPDFVEQAADRLADTPVEVATVVNFPTGDERLYSVGAVTEWVLLDGADEVDVVLPYRRFAAGDVAWCEALLERVRTLTADRATVKVILETGELADAGLIRRAADLAIDSGADFVKTSTGKTPVSATPAAFEPMVAAVAAAGRPVGLKPSGGIRTRDDAATYLDLAELALGAGWATPATFRFGASSLLDALL